MGESKLAIRAKTHYEAEPDNVIRNKLSSRNILNVLVDDVIEIELTSEDSTSIKKEQEWKQSTLKLLLK